MSDLTHRLNMHARSDLTRKLLLDAAAELERLQTLEVNWQAPNAVYPDDILNGDRIVIIVRERPSAGQPLRDRLVILEATETGWTSPDPYYTGYSPGDGIAWARERDLCIVAEKARQGGTV
jgi:hypothetical protein